MRKRICMITNNINCERLMQYYARIERYLNANDWQVLAGFDVSKVIIAGCGFHDMMYDKIMRSVRTITETGIDERDIIVVGCAPKTHEAKLKEGFRGALVEFDRPEDLDSLLESQIPFRQVRDAHVFKNSYSPSSILNLECFYIRILEGCLQRCKFCVIKKVRGPVKSRPSSDVLTEFRAASHLGYKKVFLCGEDTLAYGHDNGASLVDLIHEMIRIQPAVVLYFGSLHCRWIIKYQDLLLELCRNGNLEKVFIGLQHVDANLLTRMGREPNFAEVRKVLAAMKAERPSLSVSADILVGFPGETDAEFAELISYFETDRVFDLVHHYGYSDVHGSESSAMPDKLSRTTVALRWNRLNDVLGKKSGYNNTFGVSNQLVAGDNYQFCRDTFVDIGENE